MKSPLSARRQETTREAIIETAETLIAATSIDAVSLRQIGAAIGAGNTNVVAYHFGGKDELILAIFRYRLMEIDVWRAKMLAAADKAGKGHDFDTLLDILYKPFLLQTNHDGMHSYAAFLDAVVRSGKQQVEAEIGRELQVTSVVMGRVAALCGRKPDPSFRAILRICFSMVACTLHIVDKNLFGKQRASTLFNQTMKMVKAALLTASAK